MGETPNLTFGEELRRERLIREVSLEEISGATKISVRLLTALEKSDIAKLPAPVFTRGFIRSYSRHLGLDPDEMVNAYLADLAPEKSREATQKKGGLRARSSARPAGRGRHAGRHRCRDPPSARVDRPAAAAQRTRTDERGPRRARELQERLRLPGADAADPWSRNLPPLPTPSAPVRASRCFSSSTRIPGRKSRPTERRSLRGSSGAATKHQFEAREGFRLTLGNAGGVRVTVDGQALEPLGSSGQVVRDLRVPPPRLTQS